MGRDVFYITTPIYYPNDVPHIGHAYNAVATDFIARFHRLRGEEVFHLTGTDEHGLKLQRAAEEQGMTAQEWVDAMEPRWREVWARLDIAYDDYIRTTEAAPHGRGPAAPQRRPRQRPGRHLPGDVRGPLLRLVRGLLHRGRADRRALPDPRAPGRADGRGELLLPPLRLRGPAPRALRGAPRGGRARDPAERGPVDDPRRPPGLLDQPDDVRLGHPAARGTRSTSATSGSTR